MKFEKKKQTERGLKRGFIHTYRQVADHRGKGGERKKEGKALGGAKDLGTADRKERRDFTDQLVKGRKDNHIQDQALFQMPLALQRW